MKDDTKKKSFLIYLLEFAGAYIVVLGFLAGMLYFAETERVERLLFTSLIITTVIIAGWEAKR